MPQNTHQQLVERIRGYHMPASAVELLGKYKPLIIAGATASGKNSIAHYIQENSDWREVVTHTTRAPRGGEENGKSYWFVDQAKMLGLLSDQAMIETKIVHGDTIYGTSLSSYQSVLKSGHKPMLVIDVQGADEITKNVPDIQVVFILPPSFEAWMERLDKRGVMSHAEKERRLHSARLEMEQALSSQYFRLIVNDDVPEAAQKILSDITNSATQHQNRELVHRLIEHIKHF